MANIAVRVFIPSRRIQGSYALRSMDNFLAYVIGTYSDKYPMQFGPFAYFMPRGDMFTPAKAGLGYYAVEYDRARVNGLDTFKRMLEFGKKLGTETVSPFPFSAITVYDPTDEQRTQILDMLFSEEFSRGSQEQNRLTVPSLLLCTADKTRAKVLKHLRDNGKTLDMVIVN